MQQFSLKIFSKKGYIFVSWTKVFSIIELTNSSLIEKNPISSIILMKQVHHALALIKYYLFINIVIKN